MTKPPPHPVVWTILYIMIAIAGWKAWQAQGFGPLVMIWIVQLILNALWSWIMFARKQIGWAETRVSMYHYRDRSGPEVDLVLEAADGRIVACEVKAAQDASAANFRWLEYLREKSGPSFIAGVLFHAGERVIRYGDRLWAVPISSLWDGGPLVPPSPEAG